MAISAESVRVKEVESFINGCYVSAQEAVWRILEFPINEKSHSIIWLPVHLKNEQTVICEESLESNALECSNSKALKLVAW
jgi:hypothetical protein